MTCAFVYYGRLVGKNEERSPLEIYRYIIGACGKNVSLANDIWAAHQTVFVLELLGETDVLNALKEIYVKPFVRYPHRPTGRSEISMRVLRFAYENSLDERGVYRRLAKARRLWKRIREYSIR